MTIYAYVAMLRRRWRIVLLATVLGAAAAIGLTALMPRVYVATTTMFVRGVPGAGVAADYQAAQFAASRAKSYSVMMGNPDVLSGIISDLNLQMGPGELLSRLTVENPIDTVLINVTARGTNPDQAQAISVAAADNLSTLIVRLESAGVAGGKSPIDVQVAVPAPKPTSPSSPNLVLNVAVGLMLGLALGSISALVVESRPRPIEEDDGTNGSDDTDGAGRSGRGGRRAHPPSPSPQGS
ncbi:MAG: Wzz/FepE/Etk N-terminal domain-containing protein [Candidatus Phosphoribacter sp.]